METLKHAIDAHNNAGGLLIRYATPDPSFIRVRGNPRLVKNLITVFESSGFYTVQVWAENPVNHDGFYIYDDVKTKTPEECINAILKAYDDLHPRMVVKLYHEIFH